MRMRKGFELEREAYSWIKDNARFGKDWQHLNGKGVFDIESKCYAVDVVAVDERGYIRTEMKDLKIHYKYLQDNEFDEGIIMFKLGSSWYVIPITKYFIKKYNGKAIKFDDVSGLSQTAHKYFVDDVTTFKVIDDKQVEVHYSAKDIEYLQQELEQTIE